jgi:hypothetical protein
MTKKEVQRGILLTNAKKSMQGVFFKLGRGLEESKTGQELIGKLEICRGNGWLGW